LQNCKQNFLDSAAVLQSTSLQSSSTVALLCSQSIPSLCSLCSQSSFQTYGLCDALGIANELFRASFVSHKAVVSLLQHHCHLLSHSHSQAEGSDMFATTLRR